MFFSRKAKQRAESEEREKWARIEEAEVAVLDLQLRRATAERRMEGRIRRNHISEAVAMMIKGAI